MIKPNLVEVTEGPSGPLLTTLLQHDPHSRHSAFDNQCCLGHLSAAQSPLPLLYSDYVHRVGRTARAGRTGWSLSFVTQHDVHLLHKIEELVGQSSRD